MRRIQSTLLLLALTVMSVSAKVRLPHLIGDNMVIQQLADVRLWGWTDAGKEVKVTVSWSNDGEISSRLVYPAFHHIQ